MKIHIGNEPWQRAASFYVRMAVFVIERSITLKDEFDAYDTDEAVYSVLYDGDFPVATGRFMTIDATTCRLTRIATLKEYRGKQCGAQIILSLEEKAKAEGFKQSIIHSELTAVPFYKKQGYIEISEIYEEDGVPCQTLSKELI